MVILKGLVRDAQGSTYTANDTLVSAIIVQGNSGDAVFGVCYSSSNGTFYTSAINLDILTCIVGERQTSEFSIEDFATEYDPLGVVSGALTANGDTTTLPGKTIITDIHKVFDVNTLSGRILEMRSGVDDGKTGVIGANTANTITVGDASGGVTTVYAMERRTSPVEYETNGARMVTLHSGGIVIAGFSDESQLYTVYYSPDGGSGGTVQTTSAEYVGFVMSKMTSYYTDSTDTIIAIGSKPAYEGAVFKSTDWGVTWSELDPLPLLPGETIVGDVELATLASGNVLVVAYVGNIPT